LLPGACCACPLPPAVVSWIALSAVTLYTVFGAAAPTMVVLYSFQRRNNCSVAGKKEIECIALEGRVAEDKHEEKIEGVPDIYCDGTQMALTPYDVMIFLQRRLADPSKQEGVSVGVLRMSLEHAKVFAIMLRKNLKAYEDTTGPIPMHPQLMKDLGISKAEDW
jgi:hypothetical protein